MAKESQLPGNRDDKVLIIYIIGPPGVGKSTHSNSLVNEYGFVHLSTGDILREEAKANPGTEAADLIIESMSQALLVPDEMAISLTMSRLKDHIGGGNRRFLLDGFPRNGGQALELEKELGNLDVAWHPENGRGLWLQAEQEVLLDRIKRRAESMSAESARPDDQKDVVLKRLAGYFNYTVPFTQELYADGKIIKIDCNGKFPDAYKEIKSFIKKLLE